MQQRSALLCITRDMPATAAAAALAARVAEVHNGFRCFPNLDESVPVKVFLPKVAQILRVRT